MNILKAELVWVDDRCYRKLPIKHNISQSKNEEDDDLYPIEPDEFMTSCPNEEEENFDDPDIIIRQEHNRFFASIHVPGELVGIIAGKQCRTKTAIENDTRTRITLPQREVEGRRNRLRSNASGDIAVVGESKLDVYKACRRIKEIENSARRRLDYTHFISFPVNSTEIQAGFLKFKKSVLKNKNQMRGVDESLFSKESKLHLTLCMLTLLTDHDKERAAEKLLQLKDQISNIIQERPLNVQVKGVEYMNDDPSQVTVLYGKIEEQNSDNRLLLIANLVASTLMQTPYSKQIQLPVKLHVTLMKSHSESQDESGFQQRLTFDARNILEKYQDYVFGSCTISQLHISIRYTEGRDGYYKPGYILDC